MARIIKPGNCYFKYNNTCPNCGCIYEYDNSEVATDLSYATSLNNGIINCPYCGQLNYVCVLSSQGQYEIAWNLEGGEKK